MTLCAPLGKGVGPSVEVIYSQKVPSARANLLVLRPN